ncbi:pitrilysin family protein [Oscillospiraceae bacterium MB08-C2-2]|nr:pitrilysin family protein [Oscillospiraceae bacterium MB08-C2-2]
MSYALSRKAIGTGIHFSHVIDPKFKFNRISVNFIVPLQKERASDFAVVPFILRKGFRECPDFTALNAKLCELYGASLEADVTKFGDLQLLEVSIQSIDNRFSLENEDIAGQCAELLASVVLDPKLSEEAFDPTDTQLEKEYVIDSIDALINDKRSYALAQCVQAMCKGQPNAIRRYGDRDQAEKITPQSAAAAYRDLLLESPVEILFLGSGSPTATEEIFTRRFAEIQRKPLSHTPSPIPPKAGEVRHVEETMELSQSKLVMGFRTGGLSTPESLTAARVFAALFGGTPFSKLFLNVREKLSLCYYCAARFDIATQILMVDSGVEKQNVEKAKAEILVQLAAMQNGEITDQELANTKLLLKNGITTTTDSLSSIEGWYLSQILRGQSDTPAEDAAQIDAVTIGQVVEIAKGVTLDTIYFLTGEESK